MAASAAGSASASAAGVSSFFSSPSFFSSSYDTKFNFYKLSHLDQPSGIILRAVHVFTAKFVLPQLFGGTNFLR